MVSVEFAEIARGREYAGGSRLGLLLLTCAELLSEKEGEKGEIAST